MYRKCLLVSAIFLTINACGKKNKDQSAGVATKVRSTGLKSVALTSVDSGSPFSLVEAMTANVLELEYYKVPVRRINLVSGFDGSKYSSASPNFYSCDSSKTDDECLVDLSKSILVDNLLSGAAVADLSVDADTTYNGAAIEFCKDGSDLSSTYTIRIKGSVVLGTTSYYTSSTLGLSSSLTAAEEVQIPVNCSGKSTPFLSPVTLGPGKSIELVIYADPNGNVFATSSSTLANSNCVGTGNYSVCASLPSVFFAADSTTPVVERYALTVTTKKGGNAYRNLLVKMLVNSANAPIGASLQEHYRNDLAEKSLNTSLMDLNEVTKNDDGTYNLSSFSKAVIKNFKRDTDTGNKLLAFADAELVFNQAKMQ